MVHQKWLFEAKGQRASRLRARKRRLVDKYGISDEATGGSLSLTHRKCGKACCHCATDEGHAMWCLTFIANGKRHVESVPAEWLRALRPLVKAGRQYREAVREVMAINAELVGLLRRERTKKKGAQRTSGKKIRKK